MSDYIDARKSEQIFLRCKEGDVIAFTHEALPIGYTAYGVVEMALSYGLRVRCGSGHYFVVPECIFHKMVREETK